MRILMTGGSGCVGRYMVDEFLTRSDHELVLIVRNPGKLVIADEHRDRVTVIAADMRDVDSFTDQLAGFDAAVLAATAWGGQETYEVTVNANLAIADRLIAGGCSHILYFATASVLATDCSVLKEAGEYGSDYIKSKFQLVEAMETRSGTARITGIYPTLVIGGRPEAPAIGLSHMANLLFDLEKHAWALRFISAEGRFHIVHAADIARVIRHICENPDAAGEAPLARLVLGNTPETVGEMLRQFCAYKGRRTRRLISIRPQWLGFLERILPIQLSDWDRYCAQHPDQGYAAAVSPASYGLPMAMDDLTDGLRMIGMKEGR